MMSLMKSQIHFRLNSIDKPEDHWSCIAHLSAEGTCMLKSTIIEEKKFKNIESE